MNNKFNFKKASIIVCLLLFCSFTLCYGQQTISGTLEHDNLQREYVLYVPANYTGEAAVPLLFNFHGYTSNATEQMFYGDFRPIADTEGFLIVHPMGTLDITETTHFNVGWGGSDVDDVGFAETLIDAIASEYNIDLKRVYSTGMSNGGFMSYQLACQLSDKIAAIASVTGSMSPFTFNNCDAQHPTPVLQIHGTEDPTVPYDGGFIAKSIEEVVQYWVDFNNCSPTPIITQIPDLDPTDESTVEHFLYGGGDNQVVTEFFKITGGAHTWPGSAFDFSVTNYDINASAEAWKFMSRYDIDGLRFTTDIDSFDEHQTQVSISPNPSTSFVNIEVKEAQNVGFNLSNSLGQSLQSGQVSGAYQLDVKDLAEGVYFLKVGNRVHKVLKVE
ncbi:MAG: T9SS type A sorting domain-containing protein [Chitinophagales bacterium]